MVVSGAAPDYAEMRRIKVMSSLIEELSSELGVSDEVAERAKRIAARCIEERLQLGRSYRCVALAAIYAASREVGRPIPIKQISVLTGVPLSELRSCYNSLARSLRRELGYRGPPDPSSYMEAIAARLGLDASVIEEGRAILERVKDKIPLVGKDPTGYAAAAIYIATRRLKASKKLRRAVSMTAIALTAGVTEVTIRARVREIEESLGLNLGERPRRLGASGGGRGGAPAGG